MSRPYSYSAVAAGLHWATAAAVVAMVPMGWWMKAAITSAATQSIAYQVYQVHKSIGFAILALTLVRLAWRLMHRPPSLPEPMPVWEQFAARTTHWAFYTLLIAMPLTGWIFVSAGWSIVYDRPLAVATSWFGLFPIPHVAAVAEAGIEVRRAVAMGAMNAHATMAWGGVALAGVHVAAALKHHFLDRDSVLASMIPWLKVRSAEPAVERKGATLTTAVAGMGLVLALAAGAWLTTPNSKPVQVALERALAPASSSVVEIEPGTASSWTIDSGKSSIKFAGEHAGKAFAGRFTDWSGRIWFDPADLSGSKAAITVRTGSARTGDATQEGTLAEEEWFDVAKFSEARFETQAFQFVGGDRYEAVGSLRVKGVAVPVVMPFTLTINGDEALARGEVEIDRTALDLGMFSDPAAEWVSKIINVTVEVSARRS